MKPILKIKYFLTLLFGVLIIAFSFLTLIKVDVITTLTPMSSTYNIFELLFGRDGGVGDKMSRLSCLVYFVFPIIIILISLISLNAIENYGALMHIGIAVIGILFIFIYPEIVADSFAKASGIDLKFITIKLDIGSIICIGLYLLDIVLSVVELFYKIREHKLPLNTNNL